MSLKSTSLKRLRNIIREAKADKKLVTKVKKENYGLECSLDIHDVDTSKFTKKFLKKFAEDLTDKIGMRKGPSYIHTWGEDKYEAKPDTDTEGGVKATGISLTQFLYESAITIHAIYDINKIFLNVFSCKDFDPKDVREFALEQIGGKIAKEHSYKRI
jgi:S-adenosylmethionine decarboxylase